jgi:hypothetical protein
MRILFDNGTPKPLARSLAHHEVVFSRRRGWHQLANGELIKVAEDAGFDALLTTDKNIRYQQNLKSRIIALVVLSNGQWPAVQPHAARIVAAIESCSPGSYIEVEIPYLKKFGTSQAPTS